MKPDAAVYRYMTPCPVVASRDDRLSAAQALMVRHGIRHLPIVDQGDLVGIVSDRDLTVAERFCDPGSTPLERVMTTEPYFALPSTPLQEVAKTMAKERIGAAVIVDGGRIVGVFTAVDALRALGEGVTG